MRKLFCIAILLLSTTVFSQSKSKPVIQEDAIKSSAAYAEVLLRKAEVEATIEDLLVTYTEKYPKLQQLRYEAEKLNQELNRLRSLDPNQSSKLTLALGRLIVRKVEAEVELWALLQQYGEEHELVKRARKKLQIFENAVKEILP